MKTIKTNFKFLAIILSIGFFLQSCSNDDDGDLVGAPEITDFEYGEGSEHSTEPLAFIGSDLHVEADIYAEATVSSITLSIHAHDLEVGEGEEEWDFTQVFTDEKYQVINPEFHEHIDIPATAPAGEYHIEMTVVDALGESTTVEGHVDIVDVIALSEISIDEAVAKGEEIHAEFLIDAVYGVHSIDVDIHAHDITPADGEELWDYENEFTEGYHDQTSVEFHEHIDVPANAAAGEYHATFTITDEEGNTLEYETHIDITE